MRYLLAFSPLSLRPVVSSHLMSWLPMTFTARQPSVIEHCLIHPTLDDVITVLTTFVSRLLFFPTISRRIERLSRFPFLSTHLYQFVIKRLTAEFHLGGQLENYQFYFCLILSFIQTYQRLPQGHFQLILCTYKVPRVCSIHNPWQPK